jgi:Spo0E like sporulation regulatory protein.
MYVIIQCTKILGGEMLVNKCSENLLTEIDFCRKEMHGLLSSEPKTSEQVLAVSRKLDKLIVSYYQQMKHHKTA